MSITAVKKAELIKEFGRSEGDTGSPEVQVAIITHRITNLSAHMKEHSKDVHSRRGLIMLVGQRRRLLDYLKSKSVERYQAIIQSLGIRR